MGSRLFPRAGKGKKPGRSSLPFFIGFLFGQTKAKLLNSKLTYCLFVLLFFSGCGKSRQRLHVFIWPDYLDPKIVADFEREFDCAVTVDFYETVDLMQAKLNAGGAAVYDIVVASDNTLPALVRNGLVAPLRRESIPNRKNIDSRFQNLSFDPDNRFGSPFQWGSDGLYVRVTKRANGGRDVGSHVRSGEAAWAIPPF